MKSLRTVLLACVAGVLTVGSALADDGLNLHKRWRVEVSQGADSDGTLLFRVTPKDGQPVEVSVPVVKGSPRKSISTDIRIAFRDTLDAKAYTTAFDGLGVRLDGKSDTTAFELKLVESTAQGLKVDVTGY